MCNKTGSLSLSLPPSLHESRCRLREIQFTYLSQCTGDTIMAATLLPAQGEEELVGS